MKLSSKSLYAVRALFNMAYHGNSTPTKIDDIATSESVPPRFLEQIFQDLKRAGLVGSKRGPRGGYFLTRPARDISLCDIVVAIEGTTDLSLCRERSELPADTEQPTSVCVTARMWEEVAGRIDSILSDVTLQDLVERGEALGVRREGFNDFVYII